MSPSTPFLLGLFIFLGVLATVGCGSSETPTSPAPLVIPIGDETLVVLWEGSLSAARPTNDAERSSALSDYVRGHLELFGPDAPPPGALTYVQAGDSARVTEPSGAVWHLLRLQQTVLGAPVIDEFLLGAFVETPTGEALRRVRGLVRDPTTLPTPPDPATAPRDRVLSVASDLILEHGLSLDRTEVSDHPVVAARHGIAGYAVSQLRPSHTGSFDVFEAVVDSRDLSNVIRRKQPGCDDCVVLPAGITVAGVDAPSFPVFTPTRSMRVLAVRLANDNGSYRAPITRPQLKTWIDTANQVWWPQVGLYFEFDATEESADFVDLWSTALNNMPADAAEMETYAAIGNTWSMMFHPDKLVVYCRASSGPGWSWGPPWTFYISTPSYSISGIYKPDDGGWLPNDTALSHEIGHFMGLAHTFSNVACVDAVPANSDGDLGGQDPTTTDDDVHDTDPDMSDSCYPTPSLTCAELNVFWNQHLWSPPWPNVMSYHDCLPEELTADQIQVIERTLKHPMRALLLGP